MDVKVDKDRLADEGRPDIEKIRPVVYSPEVRKYHGIGRYLGNAFDIGKK